MGGGIPLPALTPYNPPQQDLLGNYSRIVQLRTAMQAQQLQQGQIQQQQQLKNQQAMTDALRKWDGQDYNSLAQHVLDSGGSGPKAGRQQPRMRKRRKSKNDLRTEQ